MATGPFGLYGARMTNESARVGGGFWPAAFVLIALVSAYAFFQDIFKPDWPAWILAPSLVLAFRGAISISPEDSLARAVLYQAALLIVPIMGLHGLLDAMFVANWPEWVIAPTVVVGFWTLLFLVADPESD